mmetsp:Transcript_173/g.496  ORF Transcript_173/g.496 Transcript_173/m.496 type:complete len:84 (+) Transcript_173:978-1229(+)
MTIGPVLASEPLLDGSVARNVEALVVRNDVEADDSLVALKFDADAVPLVGGSVGVEAVLDAFDEGLRFSNIVVPTALRSRRLA